MSNPISNTIASLYNTIEGVVSYLNPYYPWRP